jgi:hypothetical protein
VDTSALYRLVTWFTNQLGLLRPLEVAAALFLVVVVFKVHRQNRALHRQLIKLKARVDALQAEDYRTLMRSLNKQRPDLHMQGPPLAPTKSPAASKPASSLDDSSRGRAKSRLRWFSRVRLR